MSFPRTRTRGGFTAAQSNCLEVLINHGCVPLATNVRDGLITPGADERMSDIVIPDYKARVSRGEIFFNEMQFVRRENYLTTPGQGAEFKSIPTYVCGGNTVNVSTRYDGPWAARIFCNSFGQGNGLLSTYKLISDVDVNSMYQEVSTKCLSKRGESSSNLFESIAEIRSTLGLMRRPFNSFNKMLSKASSLRKRGVGASEAWLQTRYGVMPIIRDIGTISEGLKKKIGYQRQTTRSTGVLNRFSQLDGVISASPNPIYPYRKIMSDTNSCRAMSLDEYVVEASDNIGLATKGLITLPWELIPYSFVADWFVNFGDYLKALVPLPSIKSLGSCIVVRRDIQCKFLALAGVTPPTGYTTERSWSGEVNSRTYTKSRSAILAPGLVVKSDFRLTEAIRAGDAAALLLQKFNGVFR
jgi:hypothetical protein